MARSRWWQIIGGALVVIISFFTTLWTLNYFDFGSSDATVASSIRVISATYGPNCPSPSFGNATKPLSEACDGQKKCDYRVDYKVLGDPCGINKEYVAEYECLGKKGV